MLWFLCSFNYLARAQSTGNVPGICVAGVILPAVQVLHHPVQSPSQVILGPPLTVVEKQLLCSLLAPLTNMDIVSPGHYNLHVLKLLHVPEVSFAVKYSPVDSCFVWLLIEKFLKLGLEEE